MSSGPPADSRALSEADLRAIGDPIAEQLLPGWSLTWVAATQEEVDDIIWGALAVCKPIPERSTATVFVVSPWPAGEDLEDALWRELIFIALSPITAQLVEEGGPIVVEEQIVERIGSLMDKVPIEARRAMARALANAPPRVRARLSARETARGGTMDFQSQEGPEGAADTVPVSVEDLHDLESMLQEGDTQGALAAVTKMLAQSDDGAPDAAAPPPAEQVRGRIEAGFAQAIAFIAPASRARLQAEGFADTFINRYERERLRNPSIAAAYLAGGRANHNRRSSAAK
jgi:hypothetical protein